MFKKRKVTEVNEINSYLDISAVNLSVDPILWWVSNLEQFPHLSNFAFEILSIPASSVPCEQIFSKSGDLITRKRNRLSDENIRYSICLNSWLNFFKNLKPITM